jgi:hypothetical protein
VPQRRGGSHTQVTGQTLGTHMALPTRKCGQPTAGKLALAQGVQEGLSTTGSVPRQERRAMGRPQASTGVGAYASSDTASYS